MQFGVPCIGPGINVSHASRAPGVISYVMRYLKAEASAPDHAADCGLCEQLR